MIVREAITSITVLDFYHRTKVWAVCIRVLFICEVKLEKQRKYRCATYRQVQLIASQMQQIIYLFWLYLTHCIWTDINKHFHYYRLIEVLLLYIVELESNGQEWFIRSLCQDASAARSKQGKWHTFPGFLHHSKSGFIF